MKTLHKIGNVCDKPSNMIELMKVRQAVTSFEMQSQFVGNNFKAISKRLGSENRAIGDPGTLKK